VRGDDPSAILLIGAENLKSVRLHGGTNQVLDGLIGPLSGGRVLASDRRYDEADLFVGHTESVFKRNRPLVCRRQSVLEGLIG